MLISDSTHTRNIIDSLATRNPPSFIEHKLANVMRNWQYKAHAVVQVLNYEHALRRYKEKLLEHPKLSPRVKRYIHRFIKD